MKIGPSRHDAAKERLERNAQNPSDVAEFTRRLVHDFNNILGTALANLELAQTTLDEKSETSAYLAKVERALGRGVDLTEELFLFAADQTLETMVVNPPMVVEELRNKIVALLPLGTELDLSVASSCCDVDMNRDEFEGVLVRLVINACDAMEEGGRLQIGCERQIVEDDDLLRRWKLLPGPYAVVTVADNGTGMTETVRTRAFEPFFSTKDRRDRRGLGLSVVQGFAVRQNGCVEITSKPGGGTKVSLFLPCRTGRTR